MDLTPDLIIKRYTDVTEAKKNDITLDTSMSNSKPCRLIENGDLVTSFLSIERSWK